MAKNKTSILWYVAITLFAIVIINWQEIVFWFKSVSGSRSGDNPKQLPDNVKPLPKPTLNRDKLLYKGVKGAEVSALQKLLKQNPSVNLGNTGINKNGIDGDFGPMTEKALLLVKGVKKITLNQYEKKATPDNATDYRPDTGIKDYMPY